MRTTASLLGSAKLVTESTALDQVPSALFLRQDEILAKLIFREDIELREELKR